MMASGSSERGLSEVTDHDVGVGAGDLSHQRTLCPVAITAATEENQQTTFGQLPAGLEDIAERIGRVGIIDQHGEGLTGINSVRSPITKLRSLKPLAIVKGSSPTAIAQAAAQSAFSRLNLPTN